MSDDWGAPLLPVVGPDGRTRDSSAVAEARRR